MTDPVAHPRAVDLAGGLPLAALADGETVLGTIGEEKVLLTRRGEEVFAVGASCTHLGGPLGKGLVAGDTVRCPWHHACFSLRTGRALEAPAFDALPRWETSIRDGRVHVGRRCEPDPGLGLAQGLERIVIVGGGAAGFAAADTLRREGWAGSVTMLSDDEDAPYDRTMLSKAFLKGDKEADALALSDRNGLDGVSLLLGSRVAALDPVTKSLVLADGSSVAYTKLLLATGAEPRRPDFPGASDERVRLLRSLADAKAVVERLSDDARVVVVGGSFIGMECAAALAGRGCTVTLVAPQEKPMARVFGEAFSDMLRALHEENGVAFRLGRKVAAVEGDAVVLDDGTRLPADLVLVGIGVEPRVGLAAEAGLAVEGGVLVDASMRTSDPDIYAAGDIAAFPDPATGERIRVEHWVVAERQGQTAALAMMGRDVAYDEPPFFWTKQYDLSVRYVGHAEGVERVDIEGDPSARDAAARLVVDGETRAVATAGRDDAALAARASLAPREIR